MKFKLRLLPLIPDPANKVTSSFISSKVLLGLRVFLFVYAASIVINHVFANYHIEHSFYPYLTVLSYYCLTLYLFLSAVFSCYYVVKGEVPLSSWPKLNVVFTGLYHALSIIHLLVPIIYWGLVFSPNEESKNSWKLWLNISMHGFDGVFMLLEIFLSNHQFDPVYILGVSVVMFLYLGYALIIYRWDNFLVYSFLDYHKPTKFATSVVMVVVVFYVLSGVSYGLHRLRYFIVQKYVNKNRQPIQSKYELS